MSIIRNGPAVNKIISLVLGALLVRNVVVAQPASLPFVDCSDGLTPDRHINISTVYAQITSYQDPNPVLKYTLIGTTPDTIQGATPKLLATLFETSSVLTFNIDESAVKFCASLRAPTSEVATADDTNCTIPAGPIAFSTSTPYRHDFKLTTIATRIRAVDASSPPVELACIDVTATPVSPHGKGGYYGKAQVIFWMSVGLTIAYWVIIGVARIGAAWDRGGSGRREGWMRIKWAGTVLSSAISGERLSASPALLRFATPSMRDIIFHTQWCAGLAMVAVQWPGFAYPILRNAAWASLIYNVTLIQGSDASFDHWDATRVIDYDPPGLFANQLSDPNSPLYLDANVQNQLFLLPSGVKQGMRSFAYTVGIRPQDLFGTCLVIYLAIVASTIVLSSIIWFSDWIISSAVSGSTSNSATRKQTRNPRYSAGSEAVLSNVSKDMLDSPRVDDVAFGGPLPPPTTRFAAQTRKAWWNYRLGQSSFHRNILYGNLVRILVLFHVPITVFSCFQFSVGRPHATIVSLALAGLAFTFLSLLIPGFLLSRITVTSTGKLYEATRTLLSLGPLYYHYSPDQQRFAYLVFVHNIVLGVVIGAGQKSGTAQAIILLITEVLAALATSMWLPWGEGAHMGGMSFMFCVGRIITCVLLVILSPVVNVGTAAAGWIAYAIIIIQGLIYLAFLLMLVAKIVEGIVRLAGHLPFDKSRHPSDTGVVGALSMLPFFSSRRRSRARRHRYRPSHAQRESSHQEGTGTQSSASKMLPAQRPPYQLGNVGTSTSVPSYLRPEQASTPYQEDGDDPDGGFILGAFHDHDDYTQSQQPAHRAQSSQSSMPQNSAPPSNTGFTRVKGGRANFEDPFAIRGDSMLNAAHPAAGRGEPQRSQLQPPRRPTNNAAQAFPSSLPNSYTQIGVTPGPPPPVPPSVPVNTRITHGRKKSETAIIEDAALLTSTGQPARPTPPSPNTYNGESPLAPPAIFAPNDDDYSTDSSVKPRRKFWFSAGKSASDPTGEDSDAGHDSDQGLRPGRWPWSRGRNRSDPEKTVEPSFEAPAAKSFSVVRQPRPSVRPEASGAPSSWRRPSTAPDHGDEDEELEMSPPTTPRPGTWSRRQSSPFS